MKPLQLLRAKLRTRLGIYDWRPMDATPEDWRLIDRFSPYTMTGPLRMWTLMKAAEYVAQRKIPGDIVESGVWRGGNVMLMKHILQHRSPGRKFWLYDTFQGMAEPTRFDTTPGGRSAIEWHKDRQKDGYTDWCYASLEDVRSSFEREGLSGPDLQFVKGLVQDSLKNHDNVPDGIAIMRLDTDFYESTKAELETLYPRLSTGGVFISDDYGAWLGHRKAIDEYFGEDKPLLIAVDRACRMAIKV